MSDHHICLRPVLHDGKTYHEGESVELESDEAMPLIAARIILPAAIRDDTPAADPEITLIDSGADASTLETEEGAIADETDANTPSVESVMATIRTLTEAAYTKSEPRKPLTSALSDQMLNGAFVSADLRDEAWRRLLGEGFVAPASATPL